MAEANIHGSVVIVGDRGVLITGRSGAGKSTLAMQLVTAMRREGRFAALVADDRVLLRRRGERLLATAPAALSGLVELRGLAPSVVASETHAVVDLVARLVPAAAAPRYQEEAGEDLLGVRVARLDFEERNALGAVVAVAAHLGFAPFGSPRFG